MTPREFVFFCEGMNVIFHFKDDFSMIYEAVKRQYSPEADEKFIKSKGGTVDDVVDVLRECDKLRKFFGIDPKKFRKDMKDGTIQI